MVENQCLTPIQSIAVVIDYFNLWFKNYKLTKSGNYTGYWWVEYSNEKDVKIYFDGDIGGHFYIKIFIDNTEYFLWQFDRSVNNATQSTNKNILYQLDILKRFLSEAN